MQSTKLMPEMKRQNFNLLLNCSVKKDFFFFQLVFSLSDPTPIHERGQKLQQSGTNAS